MNSAAVPKKGRYLLYFYRGKFIKAAKEASGKYSSVFHDNDTHKRKHSSKPEISFKIIESLYPEQKKMEAYARTIRIGWDSFGNELSNINEGGVDHGREDKSTTS